MIIKCIGLGAYAGLLSSITAVFNAGGRLGFSAWADKMKNRNTIYKIMFVMSIIVTSAVIATGAISDQGSTTILVVLTLILLFAVNAGYGGGFSNVPTLLSDHYGMKNISAIHGIVLSAWAFAGLTGNQVATLIVNNVGEFTKDSHGNMVNPTGYQTVLYLTITLYVIALLCSILLVDRKKKNA